MSGKAGVNRLEDLPESEPEEDELEVLADLARPNHIKPLESGKMEDKYLWRSF